MNPHELFILDHGMLRKQAADMRAAIEKNPKQLAEKIVSFQKLVQKHFAREEAYYRILDNGKRLEDRGFVHQLRNDHAAVVFSLESLAIRLRKSGVNPDWQKRFDTLMSVFLPHLDQEEKVLFPLGAKTLSAEELTLISAQIDACE